MADYQAKCLRILCKQAGADPGPPPEPIGNSWLSDLFSMWAIDHPDEDEEGEDGGQGEWVNPFKRFFGRAKSDADDGEEVEVFEA